MEREGKDLLILLAYFVLNDLEKTKISVIHDVNPQTKTEHIPRMDFARVKSHLGSYSVSFHEVSTQVDESSLKTL